MPFSGNWNWVQIDCIYNYNAIIIHGWFKQRDVPCIVSIGKTAVRVSTKIQCGIKGQVQEVKYNDNKKSITGDKLLFESIFFLTIGLCNRNNTLSKQKKK